ncbi:MAG: plasmid mobilization protein [Phycisphaerales bacterium JB038]
MSDSSNGHRKTVGVKLSTEERSVIEEAARISGLDTSTYIRSAAVLSARNKIRQMTPVSSE